MTLDEIIQSRRSIRRYSPQPVEREKILACLEAARLAPSAENVQPWRFLVIDEPELKERVARAAFSGIYATSRFAAGAPVLVLMMARLDLLANNLGRLVQGTQFYLLDLGIAGEHFVLKAEEQGLGTCWIGWFNLKAVRKLLDIPRKYRLVAMLSAGYPASRPTRPRARKELKDIAWFNQLGD
ncbi:MAG TPA: nitroreductase family protein [Candidatus Saccharicenans sp.]|nr:nitroreductase family protein [Candidatus Saccharicenans sp.]HQO75564.1 nitroreductase family protein [Candidatus Saccharicenans sp.]HUM79193.1 nitroreductase family protein [Candidatus Saccharicenans sp.]